MDQIIYAMNGCGQAYSELRDIVGEDTLTVGFLSMGLAFAAYCTAKIWLNSSRAMEVRESSSRGLDDSLR